MAKWSSNNVVLTTEGEKLLSKLQVGLGSLEIVRVVAGSGRVSEGNLRLQSSVASIKKDMIVKDVRAFSEGSTLDIELNNKGVTEAFTINQIGVYVYHVDMGEFLYMIAQCDEGTGDYVPTQNENPTTVEYAFNLLHGSATTINATISNAGFVSYAKLNEVISSLSAKDVGLENVPNVSTNDQTPTYSEATALTKLTSGEKLSVAFGKIKKAISSLITHLADESNPHKVTTSLIGAATDTHSHNYAGASTAGGSANSAKKLDKTVKFDGFSYGGVETINRLAICGTSSATSDKAVSLGTNFSLVTGARVTVKFTNANTSSNPRLNVNDTGAKYIQWGGANLTDSQYWKAKDVLDFVYDGTYWQLIGKTDSAPISHNHSASEITSGTLPIERGGTGATSASDALTNLGASPSNHSHNYAGASTAGGVANSATKLNTSRTLDGISFNGSSNVTRFATCSTAGGTVAKTCSVTEGTFSLTTGAKVTVKFSNANTAANPTLNVNNTGARNISFRGANLSSSNYWSAGDVLDFVYDGSYWVLVGTVANGIEDISSGFATLDTTDLPNYSVNGIYTVFKCGNIISGYILLSSAYPNSNVSSELSLEINSKYLPRHQFCDICPCNHVNGMPNSATIEIGFARASVGTDGSLKIVSGSGGAMSSVQYHFTYICK